ncbi:ATP-binding protein [Spiroplasma endosymbiont of Cantharis lateralis]|uniref:ATP-binding protein n=1 Tax=Spiroplasma endosymbiont of Cantharis lateralis TaxID=3066277 RepID=UPI00313D2FE8
MDRSGGLNLAGLLKAFTTDNYFLITTIGEFIDNSISACQIANLKELNFEMIVDYEAEKIFFIDNGPGIDAKDIKSKWILFNKYDQLDNIGFNRKHVGFKRGGFWLGKKIELYTKTLLSESGTYLDIDEIISKENDSFPIEKCMEIQEINNQNLEIFRNLISKISKDGTGTVFAISKSHFESAKTFNDKIFPLKNSFKIDGKYKDNNILLFLYLKYYKFIEGNENLKLNIEIRTTVKDQKIFITKKDLKLGDYIFNNEDFLKQFENFDFNALEKKYSDFYGTNVQEEYLDTFGINIEKIIGDLKKGIASWKFKMPYHSMRGESKTELLDVSFSFLNNKYIEEFSVQDIFSGIVLMQDGRAINMGNYNKKNPSTSVFSRINQKVLGFNRSGDYVTVDKYWTAEINLDTDNEILLREFQPIDDKSKFANSEVIQDITKSFSEFISSKLLLNQIGNEIVDHQRSESNRVSSSNSKKISKIDSIIINSEKEIVSNNIEKFIKKGEVKIGISEKSSKDKKYFTLINKALKFRFEFTNKQKNMIDFKYSFDSVIGENSLLITYNFDCQFFNKSKNLEEIYYKTAFMLSIQIAEELYSNLQSFETNSLAEQETQNFINKLLVFKEYTYE